MTIETTPIAKERSNAWCHRPLAREEKSPAARGNGELILVVEDEHAFRIATQSLLAKHGYRTLAAVNGAEAIAIFSRQRDDIHAVLTDVMMPGVDGVTLCHALQRIDPEVRIVAATGYGEENRLRELQALNIGAVLDKPFTTARLLGALDALLASPASRATRASTAAGPVMVS